MASFATKCRQECFPHWKSMMMQMAAATSVAVDPIQDLKLPHTPTRLKVRFPPFATVSRIRIAFRNRMHMRTGHSQETGKQL